MTQYIITYSQLLGCAWLPTVKAAQLTCSAHSNPLPSSRLRAELEAYDRVRRPPPAATLSLPLPVPRPEGGASARQQGAGRDSLAASCGAQPSRVGVAGRAGSSSSAAAVGQAAVGAARGHRRATSDFVGVQAAARQQAKQQQQPATSRLRAGRATYDPEVVRGAGPPAATAASVRGPVTGSRGRAGSSAGTAGRAPQYLAP